MAFDSAGDLFFASENGGTNPNTIFECTAACLASGTPAPTVIFAKSTGRDGGGLLDGAGETRAGSRLIRGMCSLRIRCWI